MFAFFGGGNGAIKYPDVTPNGETPGGLVVKGRMLVGSPTLDDNHEFSTWYGSLAIHDAAGTVVNDDDTLEVVQDQPLTANYGANAAFFVREGALNGHDYTEPVVAIDDVTTSIQPFFHTRAIVGGSLTVLHELGKSGGLGLFGVAAPTAPRTLAQATITAITDANARTATQALANTLADMGALTIT